MLSQIHRNGALQKGKAITLNSVEVKIVRAETKTPLWVISSLIELLIQRVTWINSRLAFGHRLVPTPSLTQSVPALA